MKKIVLLVLLSLSIFSLKAQCPTGAVLLESQAEVDNFVATYATTCTDIPFGIEIKGEGITDVSGLGFITSIGGDLYFNNNHDLLSITGFDNLVSIFGSFKYRGNSMNLADIDNFGPGTKEIIGFNNLVSVGGDIFIVEGDTHISISTPISDVPSLEEINGFNSLTTIGGDIKFHYMDTPTMIGFNALTIFTGDFDLFHNEFPDDGNYDLFPNMPTFIGDIKVGRNNYYENLQEYTSLNFLNNLISITGDIQIYDMSITSGLQNLVTINGNLKLGKGSITEAVFTNLDTIENDLTMGIPGIPNTGIGALSIPSLRIINGSLIGQLYGSCPEIRLNNLEYLGGLGFLFFDMGTVTMDNLTYLGTLSLGGESQIDEISMNSLTELTIPPITSGYEVTDVKRLYVNSVTTYNGDGDFTFVEETLEMNALESMQTLSVNAIDLSFESLETITGDFSIRNGDGGNFNFESLHTIGGTFNVYNIAAPLDLSTLTNLHTIGNDLIITYNSGLTSLEDLSNIQQIGGFATVRFNTNLVDCTALCQYVQNNSNYTISDNSASCTGTLNTCTINEIQGVVSFSDDNVDCVNGATLVENVQVTATDGTNFYTSFTNANGEYVIVVPEGDYTLSVVPALPVIDAAPASTTLSFVGSDNVEMADFCLTYNTLIEDVAVTMIPTNEARPGFKGNYEIIFVNNGTVTQNGDITITFNDARVSYFNSSETPSSQTTNTVTWSYTNLAPFETRNISVSFDIFPPPTNASGDVLIYTSDITPVIDDVNTTDNQFKLRQTVVNSYDPNDKTVLEGEHLLIEDIDKYLHYVIRFQNEGTASAVNIRIRDIMSDLIDWTTFQPINASHNYRVELATGDDPSLEFIFDNIFLPDSTTDEPNSHGYVSFKVKPKSTVQVGDLLHNRAAIYFDFNPPIITNETETRIVEDTDNDEIYNYLDNCPNTANTDQSDVDNDGVGDVCDDDSDGDGILNVDDLCPLVANENNNDNDNDGVGDICDDDDDNDGILDVNDACPFYAGTVSGGCPFTLPASNFIIETTSETCVNQNNAKIDIKAASPYDYQVSLTNNGTVVPLAVNAFTQELIIENLGAGTYELCIQIPAENYEQCFTLEIEDPATLNANSALAGRNEYSLDLIGAVNYSIFINGEEHTVIAPSENTLVTFTKQLSDPVNTIEVKTEKECQGKFSEIINITGEDFIMYPNPSEHDIYITVMSTNNSTESQINVYDFSGRLVITKNTSTALANYKLSIKGLKSGAYFVAVITENNQFTKKLIKK